MAELLETATDDASGAVLASAKSGIEGFGCFGLYGGVGSVPQ